MHNVVLQKRIKCLMLCQIFALFPDSRSLLKEVINDIVAHLGGFQMIYAMEIGEQLCKVLRDFGLESSCQKLFEQFEFYILKEPKEERIYLLEYLAYPYMRSNYRYIHMDICLS